MGSAKQLEIHLLAKQQTTVLPDPADVIKEMKEAHAQQLQLLESCKGRIAVLQSTFDNLEVRQRNTLENIPLNGDEYSSSDESDSDD